MGQTGRTSAIGQGTWQLDRSDRRRAIASLQLGLDLGMRHIDTAELYGRGAVEREIVAPAIRGRRQEVYLASKVRPPYTRFRRTLRACEASLRRLRTDYLDLFLLHWKGRHPLEDTFAAFERLQEQGKILACGVSNFRLDDLQDAVRIAGPGRIACNQVAYSVINRWAERDMIPWCQAHRISVVAYSPLGAGRFPPPESPGGRVLDELARAHQATPRQVALRFLLRHDWVLIIPKQSTTAHVEENAQALSVSLSDPELAQLSEAFPLQAPSASPPKRARRGVRDRFRRVRLARVGADPPERVEEGP